MSATVSLRLREDDEIEVLERSIVGNDREATRLVRLQAGSSYVEIITCDAVLRKLVASVVALESRRLATAIEKAKAAVEEARRLGADVALAEPAGAATAAVEGGA